jgi:hypothetical protein
MTIQTFKIHRTNGESEDWKKLNLITSHIKALNQIGASGEWKGEKISIQDYFDKHLTVKKLLCFKIEILEKNTINKTDTLLVIQATI